MISVSVITCVWNSEPYVAQCIESVRMQVFPGRIQHVFVDGGSHDGTLERVKGLDGDVVWKSDVRGGISNAMNVGASLAQGDVIVHLHGDDYLLGPTVVDSVAAVFASTDARWVFGRVVSDIGGRQVPPGWKMPRYSRQRLLRGNFIAHPAVYMRRDFFQELGGFDPRLKYAMDYDLWLRASAISAPAYVDAHLAAHRRHGGSASTANARAAFLEDHEVRRRYLGANPMVRAFHELIHARRGKRLGARQVG